MKQKSVYSGKRRVRAQTVADANGVSANHIRDMFREGRIPGWRVGGLILFDPDEVDRALEQYHRPGKTRAAK